MLRGPFEVREWKPSKRALSLTRQIVNPKISSPLLIKINKESRALDILGEALGNLITPERNEVVPIKQGNHHHKAEQIRSFIENNENLQFKLSDLSRELGLSINNMQSSFKSTYGMTIMDYIRERRLVTAHDAMAKDGITIAQAAYLAGYNGPANFSTAFKRHFGFSPSQIVFD